MARKSREDDSQEAAKNGNGHPPVSVQERVGHISESAKELYEESRGAVEDLGEFLDLRGRTKKNPYAMVAAAVGVGYVLGGGLFTPTTSRLFRLGLRLAAIPMIKDELLNIAESALGDGSRKPS